MRGERPEFVWITHGIQARDLSVYDIDREDALGLIADEGEDQALRQGNTVNSANFTKL